MILLLALVLGCGPTEPCDEYRDNDVVWPACISRWAASADSVAEAERRCAQSPESDVECRETWVEGAWAKPSPPTREQLLRFCRSDDCAFRAIDANPPENVVDTIALCETYVGSLGSDCATHAYARWAVKAPDAAEIARVRAVPSVFAARLDAALGHMLYCQEPRGECAAEFGAACAGAQAEAAAPGFCDEWRKRSVPTHRLTQPATLSLPAMSPGGPANGVGSAPLDGAGAIVPARAATGAQPLPPLPGKPTGPAVVVPG